MQAAVTVLSELAMHNPKTYLPLAPKFYKLLTSSSSNWMTIKLVKVFGALTRSSATGEKIGGTHRRNSGDDQREIAHVRMRAHGGDGDDESREGGATGGG